MDNKDLKYLKRHYGENFAHLCRSLFPTLLEQEGLLSKIISEHFGHSRSLYEDILPLKDGFKSYVYRFVDVEKEKTKEVAIKIPEELLDEAGYILFPECQTEEDIQSFRKYWKEDEELCTFNGGRLKSCRVWFAVKKNVDEIKRENFKNPQRQDEYGTSAISIQFSRSSNSTLSIKNRYNHTVNNPDATFSNNLDNIIPGLTESFVHTYGIYLMSTDERFELPGYRLGNDGRFYKVNLEIYDICYCENNIILEHGRVVEIDKSRYILAENYKIDKQKNKVIRFNQKEDETDSFIESLGQIKEITTKKDENGNKIIVFTPEIGENIELTLNETNKIIGLNNPNVTQIDDYFLCYNESLSNLSMPKLKSIGKAFLHYNKALTNLSLPNLECVEDYFLYYNESLANLSLPNLERAGHCFLHSNRSLTNLSLPKLKSLGSKFLFFNRILTNISLPNLESEKGDFLYYNDALTNVSFPKLKIVGYYFLKSNSSITDVSLPNLESVGNDFLHGNRSLTNLSLPNLRNVGHGFLYNNSSITDVSLPKLESAGDHFLFYNHSLTDLTLPNLERVRHAFLYFNRSLTNLSLPKLESAGNDFLSFNRSLTNLSLPNLIGVGDYFLNDNRSLTDVSLPNLTVVGHRFLFGNHSITNLLLPKLKSVGYYCLFENQTLTKLTVPSLEKVGGDFLEFNTSLQDFYAPKLENCPEKFKKVLNKNNNDEVE